MDNAKEILQTWQQSLGELPWRFLSLTLKEEESNIQFKPKAGVFGVFFKFKTKHLQYVVLAVLIAFKMRLIEFR